MKYCLHYNVSKKYYDSIDEIKLPYKAINKIYDLFENYQFSYIIEVNSNDQEIDWYKLRELNILTRQKIILCLNDYELIETAKEYNIKYYIGYEVNTFYELNALIAAGVEYVRIGAPLIFECNKIQKHKKKIRVVPNWAYTGIKRNNGKHGQWIRPEDVELYEDYISTLEFEEETIAAEEAVFRIYKLQKQWPGDMQMLIHNFDASGINRLFPQGITKRRLNCGQRCECGGTCRICDTAITLTQKEFYKDWANQEKT